MRVKVITLKYSDGLQGFPDDIVDKAAAGFEVLEVRDHFFVHGGVPHLALILMLGENRTAPAKDFQKKEDPGKNLSEDVQVLYRQLREWRNERAKKEGIPSYLIFRNMQLAEICTNLPESISALREIEGIGEKTCGTYGDDVLGFVKSFKNENLRTTF